MTTKNKSKASGGKSKNHETKPERVDVYQRVTDAIVAALEQGVRPWMKPWANVRHAAGCISRPLRCNGTPYRGINVLMLWMEADTRGFVSPYYLTFNQAKALGASVNKGEHGMRVVHANTYTKKEKDENGDEVEMEVGYLKEYCVFNSQQITGLPPHFYQLLEDSRPKLERLARVDEFFAHTGAEIRSGGNRAYYSPAGDFIQMPPLDSFRDAESFAATLGHEFCHWTKAEQRLNRDLGGKRFGDAGYAMEELTAELGAAFLCADLGITPEVREDHAAYIQSWLAVARKDKRAIFTAASHAAKAVEYLHSLQPQAVHDGSDENRG